ncbi:hypothetical protein [Gordonia westfalica]|uniref:Uncharacterized protein n=1 Tax=Gordonia westfalica TaxID=158898 RepID=Q70K60_9ACTN|nr:hypothetical protein [Gordonia westfalica]CAE09121.1 hypothetical protein [Gordonia westfalica]SDT92303.1 hypothetical protein SAMN04488548_13036 [Gordonia westfalica]
MSYTLDAALADITATTGLVFTRATFGPQRSGHLAYTRTRDAVVMIDNDWQALIDNGAGVFAPSNPRWTPVHPIVIAVYRDGDLTGLPLTEVSTRRADIAVLPHLLDQALELAERARPEYRHFLGYDYDCRGDTERRRQVI